MLYEYSTADLTYDGADNNIEFETLSVMGSYAFIQKELFLSKYQDTDLPEITINLAVFVMVI